MQKTQNGIWVSVLNYYLCIEKIKKKTKLINKKLWHKL